MTVDTPRDLHPLWTGLLDQAAEHARTNIGYPGATDITHQQLADLMTSVLLNNIGSPYDGGHGRNHTKDLEAEVVDIVADLFNAPATRWGYVTGGSTEGTEHALLDARRRHPDTVVYASASAHYKISDLADKLMMPLVVIGTDEHGRMDTADLHTELARRRDLAAAVVATAGATITEAVDDIPAIVAACERLSITRRRIHVDAALSGLPLALVPAAGTPRFDFGVPGVNSIIISGHKFLSTLTPCGVLVYRDPPHAATSAAVSYTGTADVTIGGSRSGHTTLLLYASLAGLGLDAHRQRVLACRQTAEYACQRLRRIGVDARRLPHAFTVYFPAPPQPPDKWVIPGDGRYHRLICMPQVTREQIDELVADWSRRPHPVPAPRRSLARRLLPTSPHTEPRTAR
jgi:histidine decarboxylase